MLLTRSPKPAMLLRRIAALGAVLLPMLDPSATNAQARPNAQAARVVWPDEGPRTWTPRPTQPAITANDLRTRLYQFADDSMQGRRIGELGNYKGTEYIASEFRRLGLKPAGDNGTFFQTLAYGPTSFDSASSRLIIAGSPATAVRDWVPTAPSNANAFGAKVDISNVQSVFAGRIGDTSVVLDPALFRGKVAVFAASSLDGGRAGGRGAGRGAGGAGGAGGGGAAGGAGGGPALPRCDSVPDKFGAAAAAIVEAAQRAADTTVGGRGRGAGGGRGGARGNVAGGGAGAVDQRAQAAGAVAVLVTGLESMSTAARGAAFGGRGSMQPANPPAPVAGPGGASISNATAEKLFGKPLEQLTVGAVGQPISGSWSYEWRMSKHPARNVVAILPGSDPERAGEYVLVGAHNDHNGVNATAVDHDSLRAVNTVTRRQGANDPSCRPTPEQQQRIDSLIAHARSIRPPRRDSIMNGADDDGSGTVVLLEIAEQFARERPARSIIFVSHQGEEAGLLGSRWFVEHPTVPLDKIVAAHNMDMLGKGRVDQVKFGGPASVQTLGSRRLSREFGDIIDSVNAVRSEVMAIDRSWDVPANPMNRFCRSDQVNYVLHDVPVTYFSTGYAQDYHQVTDEPQYIDYEHGARIGRFIHDVMLAIANRKDRPAISGADPSYPRCR
jgi:hypothetical protein